ncbi:hypothetical protein [Streptomyces sp. NPDC006997]|uniref:hypothetical protein n=1 Tax=Streptomyces sp. NPDC006997 TaxID=3155356 RepID=UPI0033E642C5
MSSPYPSRGGDAHPDRAAQQARLGRLLESSEGEEVTLRVIPSDLDESSDVTAAMV